MSQNVTERLSKKAHIFLHFFLNILHSFHIEIKLLIKLYRSRTIVRLNYAINRNTYTVGRERERIMFVVCKNKYITI